MGVYTRRGVCVVCFFIILKKTNNLTIFPFFITISFSSYKAVIYLLKANIT